MEEKNKSNIKPEKITKPIQLLAAWLVGLISIDSIFLYVATTTTKMSWISGFLVVASIINVPMFLFSMFILQTKFRPEMQEDNYYSKYLENKMGSSKSSTNPDANMQISNKINMVLDEVNVLTDKIDTDTLETNQDDLSRIKEKIYLDMQDILLFSKLKITLNANLDNFKEIKKKLESNHIIIHELFGTNTSDKPNTFNIVIGKGFNGHQLKSFLSVILEISDGYLMYAPGDEYYGQYDNQMLIGAYGDGYRIKISNAVELINQGISDSELYKLIEERKSIQDTYNQSFT